MTSDPEKLNEAALASIRRGMSMFPKHWQDLAIEHLVETCDWSIVEDLSVHCDTHDLTILPSPLKPLDFELTPEFRDRITEEGIRLHEAHEYFQRGELPPERLR